MQDTAARLSCRLHDWLIKQVAHTVGEFRWRHRLLDQVHAGIEPSLMNDSVLGVPGHEKDLDSWLEPLGLIGHNAAADSGHDDIGQQQIDIVRDRDSRILTAEIPSGACSTW